MRPELPDRTGVVVVGGGIAGTSTAFFLATRTDREVTLVEKDTIGSGSTGDSSAILRHHYGPQEIYTEMAVWSHEFYRAFEEHTGAGLAYEPNELVRFAEAGSDTAAYAEAGADVLEAYDVSTTRYEAADLGDAFPMLDLDEYDFGVSDDDAAYSDGTDAANGFARAASEAGATVVTDTAVTDVLTEDGAVTAVETDAGTVQCSDVVVAAGPWTPRVLEFVDVEVPIERSREQVVILDPPADYREAYPELTPTTALPGGEWYVRPDFGGGVLVATHHRGEAVDPDAYERKPDEETLLELVDVLGELIPELTDADVKGQYCGVYSNTPDHDFVLDQAGPEGCHVACGFSGHGFKQGPAVGKIMADLVTAGDTDLVDVDFFSLDRFEADPTGHGLPGDKA